MAEHRTQQQIDEAEWLDAANWRYGLFYYSEADSRPWVPKRSMFGRRRFGGTPNFAKRTARQYMMLLGGLLLLVLLIVTTLERAGILR
jgi:uncharacterized membrane protein